MLASVQIARRQSEIRQSLSALVGKATPTEDETRSMEAMDAEYRANETRYRAALIAEDTERREAGADLETRSDRQFADLVACFEMRQVVLSLDEGRALSGKTAEVVAELRNAGGYRGVPVPLMALEQRNTVASGAPDPIDTRPIIDRLFPGSVAAQMGAQLITVGTGALEWPVTTSAVTAGWADGEDGRIFYQRSKTSIGGNYALLPELSNELRNVPQDRLLFLTHGRGRPYKPETFGNWFKDQCKAAGLPHCSAHGLRKGQATRIADEGCSELEIMSFLAHATPKEGATYTKKASRAKLADRGLSRVSGANVEQSLSNLSDGLDNFNPQPLDIRMEK